MGDGDSIVQGQVNAEGHVHMLLADASTMMHMRMTKGPMRLRECDTHDSPYMTLPENPSSATFTCMATPWGAGRNIGVWGTLVKFHAGACRLLGIFIAVDLAEREGRMLGRGPTRLRDLAARLPFRCSMGIVDAAMRRKGDRDASTFVPLVPTDAPMNDPLADRSQGPRPLVLRRMRNRLRRSG